MSNTDTEVDYFTDWVLQEFTAFPDPDGDDECLREEALYRFESLSLEDAEAAIDNLAATCSDYIRQRYFFAYKLHELVLISVCYTALIWGYVGTNQSQSMSIVLALFFVVVRSIMHLLKGLRLKKLITELIVSSSHGIKLKY